jgi:2-polyprenyl-3-methyl-5-hydroxy-6-metoxy-1,4-benzoquinol methylase
MIASAYDAIAAWYDAWADRGSMADDPYYPAVEALLGDVSGLRICNLACGQGRVARHLADRGARVVGVDLSVELLAIARRHEAETPRGIDYRHADARSLDGIADGTFDGVLCFMALMDIADLPPTLASVARVLTPGGWFIFALLHPCYNPPPSGEIETPAGLARTVRGYFDEGYWRSDARTGPPGKVGAYHRTLSTYVNALTDAGLMLERVCEPRATDEVAARRPVWAEVPAVLVARCTKHAPGRVADGGGGR